MRRHFFAILLLSASSLFAADPTIVYKVTIPEPEHHWLQVDATFPAARGKVLNMHMSRSSPGRYAVHEFSKNVFSFTAWNGKGELLPTTRPTPYEWNVTATDGTVHVVYKLFGDLVDGTYLAVDTTHAHMNIPATFLWAAGQDDYPIRVTFSQPPGMNWKIGSQLYPTSDPLTFTAPNLQYFMDSPTEFSDFVMSTFTVTNSDGTPRNFRIVAHSDGTQSDIDDLAKMVKRMVMEHMQVYGEFPVYEPGTYTFLLDVLPYDGGDGMEHRNSTCITGAGSLHSPQGRAQEMGVISHEYFHNWNVERIRPAGLEPFDFTRANITCCLWLAEGFTQYYGPLMLKRAGLSEQGPTAAPNQVINGSGRLVRSAVEMSQWAAFGDAARSVDPTDQSRTFISYYTYGSAIALALDLSLREMSQGKLSLDDFMRMMWKYHGKPGGPAPGLVAKPYTLADLHAHLAELTGNKKFADDFLDKYVEGREVADYARLLAQAGYIVKLANPTRAWTGISAGQMQEQGAGLHVGIGGGRGGQNLVSPVGFATPIYDAGIDEGDVITSIDGSPATTAAWSALSQRKPGDAVKLEVMRRDGTKSLKTLTLGADRQLSTSSAETLTDAQKAFRESWLGTKVK